jgi:hypothetical protein
MVVVYSMVNLSRESTRRVLTEAKRRFGVPDAHGVHACRAAPFHLRVECGRHAAGFLRWRSRQNFERLGPWQCADALYPPELRNDDARLATDPAHDHHRCTSLASLLPSQARP